MKTIISCRKTSRTNFSVNPFTLSFFFNICSKIRASSLHIDSKIWIRSSLILFSRCFCLLCCTFSLNLIPCLFLFWTLIFLPYDVSWISDCCWWVFVLSQNNINEFFWFISIPKFNTVLVSGWKGETISEYFTQCIPNSIFTRFAPSI